MAKKIIEKSEFITKFDDGSAKVLCEICKEWDEVEAGSKQANLLENWPEKAKSWQCGECYARLVKIERENSWDKRTDEIRLGQAINLAVLELSRNGIEITSEKVKVKTRFYYSLIQEIQEEHHGKN